jgi:hypothetical protein
MHVAVPTQVTPQPPQLVSSVCSSKHASEQLVSPEGQETTHFPSEQIGASTVQLMPQAPQSCLESWRLTQAPLQSVSPAPHDAVHAPFEQTLPVLQAAPQPPQSLGSVARSTQPSLQGTVPGGQAASSGWMRSES